MLHKLSKVGIFCGGLILCVPMAGAQEPSSRPQKPIPPASSEDNRSEALQADEGTLATREPKIIPDSRPLAGAQNLTLGTIALDHSFLLPSFSVVTQVGTNANNYGPSNGTGVQSTSFLIGRLGLNRTSGRSELMLDYLGGGTLSNSQTQGNSVIQGLTMSDTIRSGRWSLLFGDDFSYLSESSFGFGGLGGLGFLGIGSGSGVGGDLGFNPSFRPDLLPNQTILTNRAPRISNTAVIQTDYALNRGSSVTFLGSYEILKFIDAGFFNSGDAIFQAGYNHTLSRKDSVSIFYRFSAFTFSNISQGIDDHNVQLTYARQIAGRVSFQIGGGPEISTFQTPLPGLGTRLNWTIASALNYQFRKTTVGFNFNRGLTGGSGILQGAETNQFQGLLSRSLTRNWDGALTSGFSRNQALRQTNPAASIIAPDAWFLTARVGRRFARSGSLFFDYTARRQSNIPSSSTFSAHGVHSLTHMVSVGYTWGIRPIVIE